jgi:tRNA(fMet)-specific endonuclease VapC
VDLILDTNALFAAADGNADIAAALSAANRIAIPVVVLGEYRFGISQSRHRSDYETWLGRDLHLFSVLPIVEETTRHYAAIRLELKRKGLPVPANDAWIAALARQHRLEIVSRDAHFDTIANLQRIDW